MLRRRVDPVNAPAALGRIGAADLRALSLLVLLAAVVVLPFSLSGHPLVQGDNLTQNFPLRVLTGEDLRSGRLPQWDSLIWSGTPLLAGWNAGSMFPGTWLFGLLPAIAAWTINQLIAPVVASVGAYLFLRRLACGPLAASAGAVAFTWTGFLGGQTNHIGIEQGSAFLPFMLLALDQLAGRLEGRAPLRQLAPGVLGFGIGTALTILAGDPRPVTSSAIVALLYVLALMLRSRRRAGAVLGVALAGGLLGVACAAIQWLPGLRFLHTSQRGTAAYGFFGSGSLTPLHLLMYLALPFADGGNGNFSMPGYAGSYNLAEIEIGVGVLALVAFAAFLPELGGSLASWWRGRSRHDLFDRDRTELGGRLAPPPHRPVPGGRRLGVWYVLALVGTLLTLGSATPLGRVLVHIPLFGAERLQNRNAEILDLALVVLLALFLEDLLGPGAAGRRARGEAVLSRGAARVLALVPLAAATGFGIFVAADPVGAQHAYGNAQVISNLALRLLPYLASELIVLGAAGIVVLGWGRLSTSRLRALLIGGTALDLAVFILMANYATAPSSVLAGPTRQSALVRSLAGPEGRFALYNPTYANPSPDPQALNEIGVTDLNILQGDPSVQGYGSIVDETYAAATETHLYENLDPSRLSGETFNTLDLSVLVTTTSYLYEALPANAPLPAPTGGRPSGSSGPWRLRPGTDQVWQLGNPTAVTGVEVLLAPAAAAAAAARGAKGPLAGAAVAGPGAYRVPRTLLVGVTSPAGSTLLRRVAVRSGRATLALPAGPRAVAVSVRTGVRNVVVDAVVADTAAPASRLLLDGQLQGELEPPHWRWRSALGPFVVFHNTETRGLAWLQPPRQHTPDTAVRAAGSVRTRLSSVLVPEKMVVRSPKPALLVRSETFEPGWTARITPLGGGASRVLAVHRFGLVQVVDLPAGNWRITWHFASGGIISGMALSALGALACLLLLAEVLRRRRSSGPAGPGGGVHTGKTSAPASPVPRARMQMDRSAAIANPGDA